MNSKIRDYTGQDIDVQYDVKRCIHARECVSRLSAVFDIDKRPWIQPDNAPADTLAETIEHCPTGALHFRRKDGGAAEETPAENTIRLEANGPLYLRGDLRITLSDGSTMTETRAALCRCGASSNKPFCDNTHKDTGFAAEATYAANELKILEETTTPLEIHPAQNGPVLIDGAFELLNGAGEVVFRGTQAALCRCGGSTNKPFCDGTHHRLNFVAD
ncbi:MAG: CDGSH iron-sulfur domain-containing protein [Anaerolineae bacterium]